MACPVCPCADCVASRQPSAPKKRGRPPKKREAPPVEAPEVVDLDKLIPDPAGEWRTCTKCEVPCFGYPQEFQGEPFVCERCDPSRYEPWVFFLRRRRDVEAAEARQAAG